MLKKRGINAIIFNIRYKLIFQNEKYFCPKFLPIFQKDHNKIIRNNKVIKLLNCRV